MYSSTRWKFLGFVLPFDSIWVYNGDKGSKGTIKSVNSSRKLPPLTLKVGLFPFFLPCHLFRTQKDTLQQCFIKASDFSITNFVSPCNKNSNSFLTFLQLRDSVSGSQLKNTLNSKNIGLEFMFKSDLLSGSNLKFLFWNIPNAKGL